MGFGNFHSLQARTDRFQGFLGLFFHELGQKTDGGEVVQCPQTPGSPEGNSPCFFQNLFNLFKNFVTTIHKRQEISIEYDHYEPTGSIGYEVLPLCSAQVRMAYPEHRCELKLIRADQRRQGGFNLHRVNSVH